jgi:hypothetical protein
MEVGCQGALSGPESDRGSVHTEDAALLHLREECRRPIGWPRSRETEIRRLGKPGESRAEKAARPGAEKVFEATRKYRRQPTWKTVGYYGSPVQVDGDREALRPPERSQG